MVANSTDRLTLGEAVKFTDPDGTFATITELMNRSIRFIPLLDWVESSDKLSHTSHVETTIIEPDLIDHNQGMTGGYSTVDEIEDGFSMLGKVINVPATVADTDGMAKALMSYQMRRGVRSMMHRATKLYLYANNSVDTKQFNGFIPRYNVTPGASPLGNQVLDCSVSGLTNVTRTSALLIRASRNTVHGIYPRGTPAGLQVHNHGRNLVRLQDGTDLPMYQIEMMWRFGLAVPDPRCVVRLANIPVTANEVGSLRSATPNSTFLDQMALATRMLPDDVEGTDFFLVPRVVSNALIKVGKNLSANAVTVEKAMTQFGMEYQDVRFWGKPVIELDDFSLTEVAAGSILTTAA